jgi:hypothetical protein
MGAPDLEPRQSFFNIPRELRMRYLAAVAQGGCSGDAACQLRASNRTNTIFLEFARVVDQWKTEVQKRAADVSPSGVTVGPGQVDSDDPPVE